MLNAKIRNQDAVVRGQDMYFMGWDGWMTLSTHYHGKALMLACLGPIADAGSTVVLAAVAVGQGRSNEIWYSGEILVWGHPFSGASRVWVLPTP